MLTKPRFALPCLIGVIVCSPAAGHAQSAAQEERITASFVLALGRTPTAVEMETWAKHGPLPLADLVARHRLQLQGDSAEQRHVAAKAGLDAFGVAFGEGDAGGAAGGSTYADSMQRHLKRLAEGPAEYEQVLHRAYRLVLQRDAYSVEVDYWKRRPALSFALLAGCIEDWARRNQPGLMATTGVAAVSVNSAYLAAVRLSPAVAAEARAAAGLAPAPDAAHAAASGRNIVAPGAEQIVSVGGIHFTAAGAASLPPAAGRE